MLATRRFARLDYTGCTERPCTANVDSMTTTILAGIGAATLILHTAIRVPYALAALLRACIPVVTALRELRAALTRRPPSQDSDRPPS
jgi:hypothetical protein